MQPTASGPTVEETLRCLPQFITSGLLKSVGALYMIRCMAYAAPLLTIPWLARVLGPKELGRVAVMQGLGACITLIVEYGFAFSATRQAAINRSCPERLSEILTSVTTAKALLAALCIAASVVCQPFTSFDGHPLLYAAGIFAAVAQAFTMTWFFTAVERLVFISVAETIIRLAAAGTVLAVVRTPEDSWMVMALQGTASVLVLSLGMAMAFHSIPVRMPDWQLVFDALKQGRGALFFRIAETPYTAGNAIILGWMCPLAVVGIYSSADKLIRAVLTVLLDPLHRAIHPRVAATLASSQEEAARLVRRSLAVTVTVALGAGILLVVSAPEVIRLLLGPGYEQSADALRVLAILPLATAIKWGSGLNWMLPLGRSGTFNRIITSSAVLHIAAAALLAPAHGALGMAAAVVLTECAIAAAVAMLRGQGPHPLDFQAVYSPVPGSQTWSRKSV